jgi:hypothetical protein
MIIIFMLWSYLAIIVVYLSVLVIKLNILYIYIRADIQIPMGETLVQLLSLTRDFVNLLVCSTPRCSLFGN